MSTKKSDPKGQFIVFVDGMDGDVWKDWIDATSAVTHAFRHGAKSATIKRWKDDEPKKLIDEGRAKGGRARWKGTTKKTRSAAASKAAKARWQKSENC
jgi:hypothetical protein